MLKDLSKSEFLTRNEYIWRYREIEVDTVASLRRLDVHGHDEEDVAMNPGLP